MFSLTYNAFLIFLLKSTYVLQYPHLYKTGSPFTYLFPISFFIYAKAILSKSKPMSKYWFLLLIFPIIHVIELMPFFLKTSSHKIASLKNIFTVNDGLVFSTEGWVPTNVHFDLQFILGVFLCLAIGKLLYNKIKNRSISTN